MRANLSGRGRSTEGAETVELISLYECSQVVTAGRPSGLRWRPAPSAGATTVPTTTPVETALWPYEAHHLPRRA
jgi:hypothetical protein